MGETKNNFFNGQNVSIIYENYKPTILAFRGHHNKTEVTTNRVAYTTEIHYLLIRKASSLDSRCRRGRLILRALRKKLSLFSPLASGVCWRPLTSLDLQRHHLGLCLHLHTTLPLCVCLCAKLPQV